MTSVGYGDQHAYSNTERIVTIFIELWGCFMWALVISNLTSIVSFMDANQVSFHAH